MSQADKVFSGPIATIYDDYMGPIFFEPFAKDMAQRIAAFSLETILETAAGSGISTEAIVAALPDAKVTATDLNQAMIDVAKAKPGLSKVKWQACDATKLPFADGAFDLVATQFGVMFFPDKLAAYREVRRVLRQRGHFVFNVWDSLGVNPAPATLLEALKKLFPDDPPTFMGRIPHGYFDRAGIESTLEQAGFTTVSHRAVPLSCHAISAHHLATALCQGTPVRAEIEARSPQGLAHITGEVEKALAAKFGHGAINTTMQAVVFTAVS